MRAPSFTWRSWSGVLRRLIGRASRRGVLKVWCIHQAARRNQDRPTKRIIPAPMRGRGCPLRSVPTVLVLSLLLALPAAWAVTGSAPLPVQREIVAFHEEPGLAPGDLYMGERVVDANHAIHFVVVETRD